MNIQDSCLLLFQFVNTITRKPHETRFLNENVAKTTERNYARSGLHHAAAIFRIPVFPRNFEYLLLRSIEISGTHY